MVLVAKSGSLYRLRNFLQRHPEALNEYVSGYPPQGPNIFSLFSFVDSDVFHEPQFVRPRFFDFFLPHNPMMVIASSM